MLQGRQILGDQLMLAVAGPFGDGRRALASPAQIRHIHLITVPRQETGQPLAGFGVEDASVLDGAVHHQDGIGMHGDTGLNMAHMQPMLATGDKQGLLQQFHLVLCSSLSGFNTSAGRGRPARRAGRAPLPDHGD